MRRHILLQAFLLILMLVASAPTRAADLPLASGSPLVGFNFDDRPLLLPVQRNFQMAMLTASSELGRSCGRMEAYGWRMNQAEQERVNQIFNSTVDRLRGIGYSIQSEAPTSLSHDITLFTVDRPDKHFLFMWSAGELGLVMTLCESSSPAPLRPSAVHSWPTSQNAPQDVVQSHLPSPMPTRNVTNFTPVGDWVGDYICSHGYTGATLHIANLKGENFSGSMSFYPTEKNPAIPHGSYAVSGQYDRESQRVLINPGKWIQRPKNFFNTVMVGGFDPSRGTFSAYFQGINGCTSFEARYVESKNSVFTHAVKAKKKKHKKKLRKHAATAVVKPAAESAVVTAPVTPVDPTPAPVVATPTAVAPIAPSAATASTPPTPVIASPATTPATPPSVAPPAAAAPTPVAPAPPAPTAAPPAVEPATTTPAIPAPSHP